MSRAEERGGLMHRLTNERGTERGDARGDGGPDEDEGWRQCVYIATTEDGG